jgi:glutamate synthase domain-containing protein 3
MMRKCHLNTCPVGVATQDETLRKKFSGRAEHVVNYFTFLAEGVREILAQLGARSLDEVIGRTELLEMNQAIKHWKAKGLDYSRILAKPKVGPEVKTRCCVPQDHGIDNVLDSKLIQLCQAALEHQEPVTVELPLRNSNRCTGTMLSGEIARRYGRAGLPPGTITLDFTGVAGQSFGAFLSEGVHLNLTGDANDYVGKGMAGGRIVIRPDPRVTYRWEDNAIVGNTVLYGATGGECYFAGAAGERFAVRNSGCRAVIEGVGDHGCEYMTGGHVAVLGRTGRNFAAGMSGGLAFVLDEDRAFHRRCNQGMVDLEQVTPDTLDVEVLQTLVERHARLTGSAKAQALLADWPASLRKFVMVFPREFRRVLAERSSRTANEVAHA